MNDVSTLSFVILYLYSNTSNYRKWLFNLQKYLRVFLAFWPFSLFDRVHKPTKRLLRLRLGYLVFMGMVLDAYDES